VETQDEQAPTSSVRAALPRFEACVATHVGRRTINADAALIDDVAGLYAVADARGDAPRSRLTADLALAAVREMFSGSWASYPANARPVEEARGRLIRGVEYAHQRIHAPWWALDERRGTTFAGLVVCDTDLVIGHVGDSRAYLWRASTRSLAQQTQDHTVMGEALGQGKPHDVAASLPNAHKLIQLLGIPRAVDVQPFVRRWEPGDVALLCTDGLSDQLDTRTIEATILGAPDLDAATRRLVDRAIAHGGHDNATVLLVRHVGTCAKGAA
jgi:serine/threonine protein phosphatase PrpC